MYKNATISLFKADGTPSTSLRDTEKVSIFVELDKFTSVYGPTDAVFEDGVFTLDGSARWVATSKNVEENEA